MARARNHPAFEMRPITGHDVSTWQMREHLTNWDAAFALGFTSYQVLLKFINASNDSPVDEVREMLIRLYMLEPTYPVHFKAPDMLETIDFLFDIPSDTEEGVLRRPKCASILAVLLGRNRGSGYRWLRAASASENSVALPIRRLSNKLFSMDPDNARSNFWRATRAMAGARGHDMDPVDEMLSENGVKID